MIILKINQSFIENNVPNSSVLISLYAIRYIVCSTRKCNKKTTGGKMLVLVHL